jgi:hypothetical protein
MTGAASITSQNPPSSWLVHIAKASTRADALTHQSRAALRIQTKKVKVY